MEHPFFPTTTTRVEALRWLSIAEKLLVTRDFVGSKSFATRARDSDPTLTPAEQILAIADTLIAAERRIGANQPDWYAVLNLTPHEGQDTEIVATHYRKLSHLLNTQKNRFPMAEEALRLVVDAFSVLSDPSKKSVFDKELSFTLRQQQSDPFGNPVHHNFVLLGSGNSSGGAQWNHFPPQVQVYAGSQVEQVSATPVREPLNFMNFSSGATLSFGSGPGTKPSHEVPKKQIPEGHSSFGSNASASPVSWNKPQKQLPTERANVDVKSNDNVGVGERIQSAGYLGRIDEQEGLNAPATDEDPSFWTACPYCYYMYEYPTLYVDCTLRCQNCKRAFQGIVIPSPPPISDGEQGFFCCWGFLPMGFSSENWEKMKGSGSTWTPFSPMFSCPPPCNNGAPKQSRKKAMAPRVYIDDEEDTIDLSNSSEPDDYDWNTKTDTKKKRLDSVKRKGAKDTPNRTGKKGKADKANNVELPDSAVSPDTSNKTTGELSKKAASFGSRKQPARVAKNCGKLDLNVECSNEPEEPPPKVDEQPGPSRGEDDNIEGIGFFEGLDEFLNSLPILNIAADDKVVKAA